MNIIVEIQHPAHIHHFKNMIWDLEKKGHNIQICTTDKDVSLSLLDNYGFKYEILGINKGKSLLLGKIPLLIKFEWKMYKIAKKFRPDLFISRGSPISAHISALFHKPYIISSDSEPVALGRILSFPFANAIYIPSSFRKEIKNDKGNCIELKEKYGLIFNYKKTDDALNKAIELVQRDDLKEEWKHKRNRLLDDKIDVTKFMIWFVENYPLSFKRIKQNPEIQYQFK